MRPYFLLASLFQDCSPAIQWYRASQNMDNFLANIKDNFADSVEHLEFWSFYLSHMPKT
jgi:hypothetical protein